MLRPRSRDDTQKVKLPPFGLILLLGAFASLSAMVLEGMPAAAANPGLALPEPSATLTIPSTVAADPTPTVTKPSPVAEASPAAIQPTVEGGDEGVIAETLEVAPPPASTVATVPDGVSQTAPPLQPIPALEADLLDRLNTARIEEGLSTLTRDAELDGVALARARNLVALRYFDHYAPDGTSAFSELAVRGLPYYLAGENLARNNYPPNQTVTAAFEGLMASPGHRANILEPRFGAIGVAAVRDGIVWLYVTVFTNPR